MNNEEYKARLEEFRNDSIWQQKSNDDYYRLIEELNEMGSSVFQDRAFVQNAVSSCINKAEKITASRDGYRLGRSGGFAINLNKGSWYDFTSNEGGKLTSFLKTFCGYKSTPDMLKDYMPNELAKHKEDFSFRHWLYEKGYSKEWNPNEYKASPAVAHMQNKGRTYTPQPKEPFDYQPYLDRRCDNQTETIAYLSAVRGIDTAIVIDLIKKEQLITYYDMKGKKNLGFPLHDSSGAVVGLDHRNLYTENGSVFRGLERNSDRNKGFVEFSSDTCDKNAKVFIFEASIDALSYLEMYREHLGDNYRLIATAGVNENCVREIMQDYQVKPENLFICTDNDRAGNELYDKVVANYDVPKENRQVPPENCKDWNSYLCKIKNISEELKKNPDNFLRHQFTNSYISPNGSTITHYQSAPALQHTERIQQELPPVNEENMQKVYEQSEKTLQKYHKSLSAVGRRTAELERFQNPKYLRYAENLYQYAVQYKQKNGQSMQMNPQQAETLYAYHYLQNQNDAAITEHNVMTAIIISQKDYNVLRQNIDRCVQYQAEITAQMQVQSRNYIQR